MTTTTNTTTASPVRQIDTFVDGLDTPWAIAFASDGRMFVTERGGRIRIVDNGQLLTEPWMVIEVAATSEAGLFGIAIDPGFAVNGYVYAAYTYQGASGLQNRLVRLREEPGTGKGVADRVLLDGVGGSSIHDGGRVKFGPDGKLYWTTGDAGSPQLAQSLSSLNGKILRLNADGSIPADNPFPDSYVYSYGHRNPQGLAWEPGSGRLYATEHGPSARDEVNYIEPGKNYGWPVITGDQAQNNMVTPLINSGSNTWAPSGAAFVTSGPWAGSLLFAGLRGESLFRLTINGLALERYYANEFGRLRDVVMGSDGAIYILTNNRDGRGSPRSGDDRILRLTWQ
jgi:glucose/arabinose dehydrogenase